MVYPWLTARIPPLTAAEAQALDLALAELAALPLPAEFRLTEIYHKLGSVRLDWTGTGALDGEMEAQVNAVALRLEDRTQGDCSEPGFAP